MKWLLVALMLLTATAAEGAAPAVFSVTVEQVRETGEQGGVSVWGRVAAYVQDADGAGDIAAISVGEHTYYPGGGPDYVWDAYAPDRVFFSLSLDGLLPDPSVVTVTDAAGAEDTVTATPIALPETPPVTISPPVDDPLLTDPNIVFSWTGLPAGAVPAVSVQDLSYRPVWGRSLPVGATSVAYNDDGAALHPQPRPGFGYRWSLSSSLASLGSGDPRVQAYMHDVIHGRFTMYSEVPTIQYAEIYRRVGSTGPGWTIHNHYFRALVSDSHGWDDVALFEATAPDGAVYSAVPDDAYRWSPVDAYSVQIETPLLEVQERLGPLPEGTYALSVADSGGRSATLVTPPGAALPALEQTLPAPGSVVYSTAPEFGWEPDLGPTPVEVHFVWVWEEGLGSSVWMAWPPEPHAVYNFDGSALRSELLPGHTYTWVASASGREDDRVTDDRVSLFVHQEARSRFTVYEPQPARPNLVGKLVFTQYLTPGWGQASIQQYAADAATRTWLGPLQAEHPAWSPDGAKLAFSDGGIWVDRLGAGEPIAVSDEALGWATDPAWSPDGTELAYSRYDYSSGTSDLWISTADGAESRPLLEQPETDDRYSSWSPDGTWIGYRRMPSAEGEFLCLVHPDGTGNHPLLASEVVGYPGYSVGYMGTHAWSPDARRLAVEFDAKIPGDPLAPIIHGIGVISREGGPLTPVFLASPEIQCCAAPKLPSWSPDGASIVFFSGHHLPANPEWGSGAYEPGVELWLISADGTGEPVRLSYDYSLNGHASWWAPNTPAGSDVSVTKGDATVAFTQVLAEGSTAVCVTPEAPAPAPAGYALLGDCWQLLTDAQTAGDIVLALACDPALVPADRQLRLLAFDGARWTDITTGLDATSPTIRGQAAALTHFSLALLQTWFEDDDPAIVYTGAWSTYLHPSASAGHAAYSAQTGASAEFTFTGTGIRCPLAKGPSMGKARVSLDGGPGLLVDLYSSTLQLTTLEKLGLPAGEHTVRMEVSGQKNWRSRGYVVNLDALEVVP